MLMSVCVSICAYILYNVYNIELKKQNNDMSTIRIIYKYVSYNQYL